MINQFAAKGQDEFASLVVLATWRREKRRSAPGRT
jgi:hypothetical protein